MSNENENDEETPSFEIKVAVLGHVSVGKTTVLNALFQDYFSEVSRRPTTAGVNLFRIVSQKDAEDGTDAAVDKEKNSEENDDDDDVKPKWTAALTLQEISADNKKLRKKKKVIQEKSFDICLPKPLVEMHENTSLVFVDIPGLNEADTKMMYLDYIREHWDTFDCVMIVMDAEKGVSTEEEVKLLQFAKRMLSVKKKVPIIILCNKVDDPDDDSLMELVHELQKRVEKVFGVDDRTKALEQLVACVRDDKRYPANVVPYPVFIPMSAGNAFAYRAGSNCSFAKFQQLDSKLIDKIGCDEMGLAKWKKLSRDKKYKIAFDAMSDPEQYEERLATTNFDVFLSALDYTVGGSATQCNLLKQQTEVALRHLSTEPIIAHRLVSIYNICQTLNRNANHLKAAFWKEYKVRSKKVFKMVPTEVDVSHYNSIVDELTAYSDFVRQVEWMDEEQKIVKQMTILVRSMVGFIVQRESEWKIDNTVIGKFPNAFDWNGTRWERPNINVQDQYTYYQHNYTNKAAPPISYPWHWQFEANAWRNIHTNQVGTHCPGKVALSWSTLTYHDWTTILGSLLLVASNPQFYERFGREKLLLEQLHIRHTMFATGVASGKTPAETSALEKIKTFTQGSFVAGEFVPKDPLKYQFVVQVKVPELLSDPSHYGHAIWKVCKFLETVDMEALEETDGTEEEPEDEEEEEPVEVKEDAEEEEEAEEAENDEEDEEEEEEVEVAPAAVKKAAKRKGTPLKVQKRKRGRS